MFSITTPHVPILSSGKKPDLTNFAQAILLAVANAGRKAQAQIKRTTKKMTINDAVTHLLPGAYEDLHAGRYWVNARQLMYAMRPDILRMCGIEKFSDATVTQKAIPAFMAENLDLTVNWKIAYDKRGHLHEPHTGTVVGLGTVEVATYTTTRRRIEFDRRVGRVGLLHDLDPAHRFQGLLFVEKEGFAENITDFGILERFDLATGLYQGNV